MNEEHRNCHKIRDIYFNCPISQLVRRAFASVRNDRSTIEIFEQTKKFALTESATV